MEIRFYIECYKDNPNIAFDGAHLDELQSKRKKRSISKPPTVCKAVNEPIIEELFEIVIRAKTNFEVASLSENIKKCAF